MFQYLTQRNMISTWLTEIFLDDINALKEDFSRQEDYNEVVEEFRTFLADFKDHLHDETTFQLISSHGLEQEMLFFAKLIHDWDRIISFHVQQQEYDSAVNVLQSLVDLFDQQNVQDVFYKFIPVLIYHEPKLTVDCMISVPELDQLAVLPALTRYSVSRNHPGDKENHAIRYLESCIESRNEEPALHNYLVSLYVKLPSEEPLLAFMKSCQGDEKFDLKYALRLAHQENKLRCAAHIYFAMNLYAEAVRQALAVPGDSFEIARGFAEQTPDHFIDKKKLWLMIGQHVVENEKNVKKAIQILQSCSCLAIEDILPLFPDDVQIGDFRTEISRSLSTYAQQIEDLKQEMEVYTSNAKHIRADSQKLRNRFATINARKGCNLCGKPAIQRAFYAFPCRHLFHVECAEDYVKTHLSLHPDRMIYFGDDLFDLEGNSRRHNPVCEIVRSPKELAKSECVFCGDIMIESVGQPLLRYGEDDREIEEWKV